VTAASTAGPSKVENVARLVILLAIGAMAGAAAFTHVHDLTVKHGQPEWIGWANATALELMSVYAGLELRRRKQVGAPVGFAASVLAAAVLLSLAVQVADAEASAWGWILAALPALAFLVLVKFLVSAPPAPRDAPAIVPEPQDRPTAVPARPAAVREDQDDVVRPADYPRAAVPADLLIRARSAAADHIVETGRPITRDALRAALGVSNGLASDLLAALRQDDTALVPAPVRPVLTANANGHRPS